MAKKKGGWKRSPRTLAQRLERIRKSVPLEATGVIAQAVAVLEKQLAERYFPAKVVNRQDAPSGKRRLQSVSKAYTVTHKPDKNGVGITITMDGYYTAARTKAVGAIFASLGKSNLLRRPSLLVYLGNTGGVKRFRSDVKSRANGPERRLRLSSHSSLAKWAARPDRGQQELRHVIRLPKEVLRRLILQASLKKAQPELIRAWEVGVRKGFL